MERLYERYCACGYRVTTDSRAIRGGEIFFALRGENFDGNDYAMRALEAGAAAAVVAADAGLQGLEGVVIAVEILSPQGEEDLPAADRPAVGGDPVAAGAVSLV